jgi:hypothetical protein
MTGELGGFKDHELGALELGMDVGERKLNALILANGAPKEYPGLAIVRRTGQRCLADADGLGSNDDAFGVDAVDQMTEPPPS